MLLRLQTIIHVQAVQGLVVYLDRVHKGLDSVVHIDRMFAALHSYLESLSAAGPSDACKYHIPQLLLCSAQHF